MRRHGQLLFGATALKAKRKQVKNPPAVVGTCTRAFRTQTWVVFDSGRMELRQGKRSQQSRSADGGDGTGDNADAEELVAKRLFGEQRVRIDRKAELTRVASALQRIYTYYIVRKWVLRRMCLEAVKQKSHPVVREMVYNRDTVKACKRVLKRVCSLTRDFARACLEAGQIWRVSPQIFIAGYLIVPHCRETFKAEGEVVDMATNTARDMLQDFEGLCCAVLEMHPVKKPRTKFLTFTKTGRVEEPVKKESVKQERVEGVKPMEQGQLAKQVWRAASNPDDEDQYTAAIAGAMLFPTKLARFMTAFDKWKLPDERMCCQAFGAAINRIYTSEKSLVEGGVNTVLLRKGFQTRAAGLRERVRKICRAEVFAEFTEEFPDDWSWCKRGEGVGEGGSAGVGEAEIDVPSFFPTLLNNEEYAHEVNVEPGFTYSLGSNGARNGEEASAMLLRKAREDLFWASLASELGLKAPSYLRTTKVLCVIKDVFETLGQDGQGLAGWKPALNIAVALRATAMQRLGKALPVDWGFLHQLLIDIQSTVTTFELGDVAKSVKEPAYTGVCAPASRTWKQIDDGMVAAAAHSSKRPAALGAALEFLIAQVKMIHADVVNVRLRKLGPTMKNFGVAFEKSAFKKRHDRYEISLEHTREWLDLALQADIIRSPSFVKDMITGEQLVEHLEEKSDTLVPDFLGVLQRAVHHMVTTPKLVIDAKFPETLLLDVARIKKFNSNFLLHAALANVLVIISHHMNALRKEQPAPILEAIVEKILQDPRVTSVDVSGIISVAMKTLEDRTTMSDGHRRNLEALLHKSFQEPAKVLVLMTSRLAEFTLRGLQGGDVDIYKDNATAMV